MEKINNREALLAFNCFTKIGPVRMTALEKYFCSSVEAYCASAVELNRAGLSEKLVSEFTSWRKTFDLSKMITDLKEEGINFITWNDDNYPAILKEISDPPFLLYYKGSLSIFQRNCNNYLSVVGSRNHSAYGEKILSELLPPIINAGLIIVSGLALGIDALAHKITLLNNGLTIAVLGTGLDSKNFYPPANSNLAKDILKNGGLIISEFPLGTPALKQNFPQRNRIISGLARACLVIEAKEPSGALITAAHALDQNREVLAVPGNIFSEFSKGPNTLIKAGAISVLRASNILETYDINESIDELTTKKLSPHITLNTETEKLIYDLIKQAHDCAETISVDEIIKKTKLDTALINSTLSILEIRGVAKCTDIGYDIN